MPSALILIADGTEEIEFVTPYDVLTRAGFTVQSLGVELKNPPAAKCSRNVHIVPDDPSVDQIDPTDCASRYDILIIPGGGPGAKTFCGSQKVLSLISEFRRADKHIACICAGTTALVTSVGKLGGDKVKVTSHPSVKEEIKNEGWEYSEDRVVVSGKIITSRGPGTAMGWALRIVQEMLGQEKAKEVEGPMICAETM